MAKSAVAPLPPPLDQLTGGDRRSVGRSAEVATEVVADPSLLPALIAGMATSDPLVRMRAADVVEKVTREHPAWLQPFKTEILDEIAPICQQEVRWHVAQLLPRLVLTPAERASAVAILRDYLQDKSRIVVTFAMQALADFVQQDAALAVEVVPLLEELTRTGSPAMRSRGRKLLTQMARMGG